MRSNNLLPVYSDRRQPIVLLHGWGMGSVVFDALRTQLALTRTVYVIDLPGYGLSPWDDAVPFSEQVAVIVSALPEALLMGWSMGGIYAIEMARQQPEQFSALVLVCHNPCFVQQADWKCAVDTAVFDAFSEGLNRGWLETMRHFLALQMPDHPRRWVRALMAKLQSAPEPKLAALQFGLNLLRHHDSRIHLAEMALPIKVILGARDRLVPVSVATEITQLNPRIQIESLTAAAHAPFLSHAAEFMKVLFQDKPTAWHMH